MEVKGGIESRVEEESVLGSGATRGRGLRKLNQSGKSALSETGYPTLPMHARLLQTCSIPGGEQPRWTQLPSPPTACSSPCTKSSEGPLLSLPLDLRATAPHTHPCPGTSGGPPQPSPTSLPHLWPPGRPRASKGGSGP